METINGYKITKELSNTDAGTCRWGFCEKDDKEYFIKELLSPVWPSDDGVLSEKIRKKKIAQCEKFYEKQSKYYDKLRSCSTGNIVYIKDFFRYGSKYYLITDKIETANLSIADISALSPEIKLVIFRAVLFSFKKLHEAGIVHSDVKPNNIIIKSTTSGYFTAKIIDFDAGFLVGAVPTEVMGDEVYFAPETRLRMDDTSIELDQKIDVFALGILFHQYWTGELPSFSKEFNTVFQAVLNDAPISLSKSLPENLSEIITKMLEKEPSHRPTVDEVFSMLNGEKKSDTVTDSNSTLKINKPSHEQGFRRPGRDEW